MRKLINTILMLGKVAILSRPVKKKGGVKKGPLIIMGNGPSLADTISREGAALGRCDLLAVNFAANTKEFFQLKPAHYVLADPHFFSDDPLVKKLWENIGKSNWHLILHVPVKRKKDPRLGNLEKKGIGIRYFNMTPGEGYDVVCRQLYGLGLAMPRPRNVLIPAIMEGIREGYKEIYIVGADHTWPHTLYVDSANRVVTRQPHYYEENKEDLDRIAEAYAGIRLHEVLESMVIAFRSYHAIERFAKEREVKIYNSTPGSLIDAFERRPLPSSDASGRKTKQ